MATVEANGPELLKAVSKLGPEEFDAFLEQALSLRNRPRPAALSGQESRLIKRINRGLPDEVGRRFAQLSRKRTKKTLTSAEQAELLKLTHEAESRDVERARALLELAKLRRVPIRMLMKQMGIKAAPLHG
jgi:hypothetical protein